MEKILVVEDDENISEMVSDFLISEGFEVEKAFHELEKKKQK